MDRLRVEAGTVKVGDIIHKKVVLGLGKVWEAPGTNMSFSEWSDWQDDAGQPHLADDWEEYFRASARKQWQYAYFTPKP